MKATNDEIIRLSFPRSAVFSSIPRTAIQAIGDRLRLSDDQISDLKLAVGEACTNAIKFADETSAEVCVMYKIHSDCIEIEVKNCGQPFHLGPAIRNDGKTGELKEGGMGLYLIKQLMDEMHVKFACGETSVTMVKKFVGSKALCHRTH